MAFLSKYGVARHIYVPVIKRAVVDFAVGADWSPAAGDVKISKDGGAAANVTNLPAAIAMGNTAMWDFSLTATEMQAAQITVTVADAATKAVEDTMFVLETYGNASGQHEFDLDTPTVVASSVSALAANVITAASINADAITAAKIADGAIDAATFAAGAINAAAIAADAITDAKVAADVTIASVTGAVGSVTGAVGSVTGAVGSVTGNVGGNVTGSVGSVASGGLTRASFAADTGLQTIRSNTAQTGAAATVTLDASASATDSFYVGAWILLTGGVGVGQARLCTAYVGATKVATVAPNWATNPDNTSTFAVLAAAHIAGVQGNVTGSVGSVTGNVGGNVTGSVGSVTGNVGGNVVGSVGSVTAGVSVGVGGIVSTSFGAAAIDAAAIAPDAIGASELAAGAANEIADAILARNVEGGSSVGRTVSEAFCRMRNKVSVVAGNATVYKTDDSTTSWTAAVTTAAGNPVSEVDPA